VRSKNANVGIRLSFPDLRVESGQEMEVGEGREDEVVGLKCSGDLNVVYKISSVVSNKFRCLPSPVGRNG
jgi:hypothetical protein